MGKPRVSHNWHSMGATLASAVAVLYPTLRFPLPLALLAALILGLPAHAQAPMSDAERARRDAEKVFNFIRFQTVRKPPAEGEAKPPRPRRTAPAAAPAPSATPAAPAVASPSPAVPAPAATAAAPMPTPASSTPALPAPAAPTAVSTAPVPSPVPAPAPAPALVSTPAVPAGSTAAAEPEEEDEEDEDGALRLVSFTAPELSTELQRTLGPSPRNIKVRFTVEADGRVSQAQAQEGTPRRLANVATLAIRQWRFDPLPRAREVDVEIAFRRD